MDVILVVSSEGRIGNHVRSVLGAKGWWVTTASGRQEALRAAADQQPGLVIVDCLIEGAAELVRVFGSKNGGPGVLLLEPPGDEGAFHAFEAGADQILSKPPRAQALIEAAERVMSLPHQSTGSGKAQVGEKLGAAEIFGDLLVELEAIEPERDQKEASESKGQSLAELQPPRAAPPTSDSSTPPGEVPVAPARLEFEAVGESESPPEWVVARATEVDDEASRGGLRAEPAERRVDAVDAAAAGTLEPEPEPEPAERRVDTVDAAAAGTLEPEPEPEPAERRVDTVDAAAAGTLEPEPEPEPAERRVDAVDAAPTGTFEPEPEPEPEPAERRVDAVDAPPTGTFEPEPAAAGAGANFEFDPETLAAEAFSAPADASVPPSVREEVAVDFAAAASEPAGAPGADPVDRSQESVPQAPVAAAVSEDSDRFGQYRLDERIAVGGMAEIWRASMLGMEGFRKTVAIKKILPHLAENEEFVTMFIEEAKLAAQLSHENLVEIYDLGKIGESFFIAMEYVDGKDLRGVLNRLRQNGEQLPIGLALLIGAEVARGLDYAHARADGEGRPLHLVHRDVSPRNVLIGHDGRVRLCDFGVAKAVSSVVQTQIGALKGKLQYMSPEQASGRQVDNRSDIYSLGSVMYEMISGRRLYEEDNEISLLDAARAGNFDDPRKHSPGLPDEVRRILIKALAKKPSARFQSAGDLEQELRSLLRTLDPPPGAQVLRTFLSALFAPRTESEEDAPAVEGNSLTAQTGRDSAGQQTRTFPTRRALRDSKVVRFWWGVAAGLAAAGLAAALLVWLLS